MWAKYKRNELETAENLSFYIPHFSKEMLIEFVLSFIMICPLA
jgi:hypothetical protein